MERTTKTVEREIFISKDGREFDSEEACLKHEAYLDEESEYKKALEHIKGIEVSYSKKNMPGLIPLSIFVAANGNLTSIKSNLNRLSHLAERDCRDFTLNNSKDAKALATVMAHESIYAKVTPEEVFKASGKLKYPCVAMCSNDYRYGREICTFEKEAELINKYLKLHGYRMKLIRDDSGEKQTGK